MVKFKSLAAIQAHLEKNVHLVMNRSAELERVLADVMVESIMKNVYNTYEPETYDRRGEEGGLADSRNMIIENVVIESDGRVRLTFSNIAEGRDTLQGGMLVDAFEDGGEKHWQMQGEWSRNRSFIEEASEMIKQNPTELVNSIKSGLRSLGMIVK